MIEDTGHDDEPSTPRAPRRRGSGLAPLAILVAIVALAIAAWSAWRLHRFAQDEQATRQHDAVTIAALQSQLAAGDEQARTGDHRIAKVESALDDLRATTQGLDRRIANLETAYTNLSGQQQSAKDTVLLNDAEMLLRTGAQRYDLFHDSSGALKAYSQAIEVLAQVQNPAYAPVRASATTERDALAAVAPQKPGFWSRVGNALGGIVKVSRDNEKTAPLTDARFARQMLALDLAQAQEALLAFDDATYRAALQRADAAIVAQFDRNDA